MPNLSNCTFANQTCAEYVCGGFNQTAYEWITSDNKTGYKCELVPTSAQDLFRNGTEACKDANMACSGGSTASALARYPCEINWLMLGLVGMVWLIKKS